MMKQLYSVMCALVMLLSFPHVGKAANTTFDYQNYNHGYCPQCSCCPCKCNGPVPQPCAPCGNAPCAPCGEAPCAPCAPAPCAPCAPAPCAPPCGPQPCAPACGVDCGISLCAIGVAVAALVAAAVIIVSSGNGHTAH